MEDMQGYAGLEDKWIITYIQGMLGMPHKQDKQYTHGFKTA